MLSAAGAQIASQKYAIIAFSAAFVYDCLLTLDDEIMYIWRRQFSLVTLAYFINRYYAMICFALLIFVNFSVAIDASECKHFAALQAYGDGIPLSIITNLVVGLRVYALYGRNRYIAVIFTVYIIAELGVLFWIYFTPSISSVTFELPGLASNNNLNSIPLLHLCIVSASSRISELQSSVFLFMQVVYDSVAFGLILAMTASSVLNDGGCGGVRALIVKNGVLYYGILFSAYSTWGLMTIFSPPGLKRAAEVPTIIVTCLLVNKLTLSLRAYMSPDEVVDTGNTLSNVVFRNSRIKRRRSWIGTSTFEFEAVNGDGSAREGVRDEETQTFELQDRPSRRSEEEPESGLILEATSTRSVHED